jgi:hypothetical protein
MESLESNSYQLWSAFLRLGIIIKSWVFDDGLSDVEVLEEMFSQDNVPLW